jgi:hypothetical protein
MLTDIFLDASSAVTKAFATGFPDGPLTTPVKALAEATDADKTLAVTMLIQ